MFSVWLAACEVWVAIVPVCLTLFPKKIEQRFRDALSGLLTIFAHPHEGEPIPGPKKDKNNEPAQLKLPIHRDKAVEIRQLISIAIADSLDAIKRDAAYLGQPRNAGCLHVDQAGFVGFGKALLFVDVGDPGTGDQPVITGRTGGNKALSGAGIDDAGDVADLAGREFLAQCSRPADGDD